MKNLRLITLIPIAMKKFLFSMLALSFVAQFCFAQWNSNSTSPNYSLGNVGIGITNPSNSLQINVNQVNGDGLKISNSNSSAYLALFSIGSSGYGISNWANSSVLESVPALTGGLVLSSYTGNINFQTNNRSNRMTILNNGNVGIGTATPNVGLLQIASPDQATQSAIAVRQSNNAAYGFDFAVDQTINGMGYWYGINNGTRTSLLQFDRNSNYVLFPSGNVGIGANSNIISTYGENLVVQSKYAKTSSAYTNLAFFGSNEADNAFGLAISVTGASSAAGRNVWLSTTDIGADPGGTMTLSGGDGITIKTGYAGNGTPRITVNSSGFVGIGTTIPDQLLSVAGTIHSSQVKVDLNVPGPDYVFKKNYNLPQLKDVKSYIDKYHHLSDIPSAAQMKDDGVDLGEMNMKLLKKVEELTLYLIEKDKQITIQEKQLNQQVTSFKKLEKRFESFVNIHHKKYPNHLL